jgi:hypothetical protein
MKDCCEGVEFTDPVAQVHVEDDCTVVVELDGVGAQGPPGTAATVNVGTTSTLSAGSPATVANSGTQNAAILDFGIPEGPQGPAATIAVGTTSTLAPGSPATVGNSGTSSAAIFDFGIPEGQQGLQGLTGPPGIEVDATPPVDTTILWADTTEPGDQVIPPGGGTGDVLAKVSSNDYDSGWVTLTASDVGAYPDTNPSNFIDAAGAPVQSVNSQTGTVSLGADDLSDVDTSGISDGDALIWDQSLGLFVPTDDPLVPAGGATGQVLVKASGTDYDTAWTVKPAPGLAYQRNTKSTAKFYAASPFVFEGGTVTPALETVVYSPLWITHDLTITQIGLRVITGAAGSLYRLGVYSADADGNPDALLLDAGTLDASTAGHKGISGLSLALTAGEYWTAVVLQGATGATTRTMAGAVMRRSMNSLVNATELRCQFQQTGVSAALPASATVSLASTGTGVNVVFGVS